MIFANQIYDFCHVSIKRNHKYSGAVFYLKPSIFPFMVLAKTVNTTRLIVLMGINIAAIRGDSDPVTANDNPTKL